MNAEQIKAMVQKRREGISRLVPVKVQAQRKAEELRDNGRTVIQNMNARRKELELLSAGIPGFFPTPPEICGRMTGYAELYEGLKVLEPSAGSGNIAAAIREYRIDPYCIEYNYSLYELLKGKGYNVQQGDFLEHTQKYDRILMNPPFEKGIDAKHILHALGLLNDGGIIVAICSAGLFYRDDREDFRAAIDEYMTHEETLESGTFKQSGTMVQSKLIVLKK